MGKPEPMDSALLDELRHWGGPDEMSAFEGVMWLAEVDPRLRSTITSILVFDTQPGEVYLVLPPGGAQPEVARYGGVRNAAPKRYAEATIGKSSDW